MHGAFFVLTQTVFDAIIVIIDKVTPEAIFIFYNITKTEALRMKKRTRITSLLLALVTGLSLAGCSGGEREPERENNAESGNSADLAETASAVNETEEEEKMERTVYDSVVIIGVDGAGTAFYDVDTPGLDRAFGDAALTYNVLTANPTISAQCWGSLMTGVAPYYHTFTNDALDKPNTGNYPYPTIFKLVHDSKPELPLAAFCGWSVLATGMIEQDLPVKRSGGDDASVTSAVLRYLDNNKPGLLFVHFDGVDHAGHTKTFGGKEYYDEIKTVDGYIGQIYDKLEEKGYLENTLLLITADHGGVDYTHGGLTDVEKYVFFGARGKSVNKDFGVREPNCDENGSRVVDMLIRDIPAIVSYALDTEGNSEWDSYIPTGLFLDNMTPEARPETAGEVAVLGKTTPAKGEDGYIGNYLDETRIRTMLTFDGGTDDFIGEAGAESSGKVYYVDGVNGQSVNVSGEGNICLNDVKLGKDSFTIAVWVQMNAFEGDPCIYSNKNWDNGSNNGIVLCAMNTLKFNVGFGGQVRADKKANYPGDDAVGEWMHTILSCDRESNTVKLYTNFREAFSMELPEGLKNKSFDGRGLKMHIGQDGRGTYGYSLNAQIDDFIIYDGAMTDDDVKSLAEYYKK